MATNEVNEVEKGIENVTLSSKSSDEPLPQAKPQTEPLPEPVVNNVHLVTAAFKKQQHMNNKWNTLIEEAGNNLRFKNENPGLYKVKDAFILLQNYLAKFPDGRNQLVQIQIGGRVYLFRIQKSGYDNAKRQLYIQHTNGKNGATYEEVFTALDKSGIDQRDAARYILEASEALINEAQSDWTTRYPFLDQPIDERPASSWTKQHPSLDKPPASRSLVNVLNEIMVVGQVAEAAPPTEAYFSTWMEISESTTGQVQTAVQQAWEAELQKTQSGQFDNYDKLFSLAEELSFPDNKQEATKVKVNSLLGIQSMDDNSIYEGLKKAREEAIKAGGKKHESLRKKANLKKEGRVPFADEAFRLTLERISRANGPVRWRDYFPHFFPMCAENGGTEIGRYDIIHSKHIRESIQLFNPNYITENLGSL